MMDSDPGDGEGTVVRSPPRNMAAAQSQNTELAQLLSSMRMQFQEQIVVSQHSMMTEMQEQMAKQQQSMQEQMSQMQKSIMQMQSMMHTSLLTTAPPMVADDSRDVWAQGHIPHPTVQDEPPYREEGGGDNSTM